MHTPSPHSREGSLLWLIKMVAGLLIVVVLIFHLAVNHLAAPGGLLSYQDILLYYQNPLIPLMEAAFVILVVVHSLIGLRSIILDLAPSHRLSQAVDVVLVLLGAAAIIYGLWLIWIIVERGTVVP